MHTLHGFANSMCKNALRQLIFCLSSELSPQRSEEIDFLLCTPHSIFASCIAKTAGDSQVYKSNRSTLSHFVRSRMQKHFVKSTCRKNVYCKKHAFQHLECIRHTVFRHPKQKTLGDSSSGRLQLSCRRRVATIFIFRCDLHL